MNRKNLLTLLLTLSFSFTFAQLDLQVSDQIFAQTSEDLYSFENPTELKIAQVRSQEEIEAGESFFEAGDIFLGLSLAYSYNGFGREDFDPKTTTFLFTPCLWYFLNVNLAIGGQIGYDLRRTKSTVASVDLVNALSLFVIDTYIRYHYFCGPRVAAYGQAGLGFGFGTDRREGDNLEFKESLFNFNIGLAIGAIYHLTARTMLYSELGALGYSAFRRKPENGDAFTTGLFELAFLSKSFTLGFVYMLNGSRKPRIE